MFFVIWSKRMGTSDDSPLWDYWRPFECIDEAKALYEALINDDAIWSATIAGNVLASTDYETTTQGEQNNEDRV